MLCHILDYFHIRSTQLIFLTIFFWVTEKMLRKTKDKSPPSARLVVNYFFV